MVLIVACLVSDIGQSNGAANDTSPPIAVDIPVIKNASDKELYRMSSVRVQGVVTYLDRDARSLFLQNPSGAIYVSDFPGGILPEVGLMVEVTGQPSPGRFAPIIRAVEVRSFGKGTLPAAPLVPLPQLSRGGFDSQRVQVSGSLHSVRTTGAGIEATLWDGQTNARLIFQDFTLVERLNQLNGRMVRVIGIAAPRVNENRQAIGARLVVASGESVDVLSGGQTSYEIPVSSLRSLLRYGSPDFVEPVRHVTGEVTAVLSTSEFFLDDGSAGVLVITPGGHDNRVGDGVEVTGPTTVKRRHIALIGEDVLKNRKSVHIPEFRVEYGQDIANPEYYGRRVFLTAIVLGATRFPSSGLLEVVLDCGGQVAIGIVRNVASDYPLPGIGAKIEMKGVLEQDDNGSDSVRDLTLHASGVQDLRVISQPPVHWKRILPVTAWFLGIGLVAVSVWVVLLRKEVASRTATLKDSERDLQASLSATEVNRKWLKALVNNVPDAMWLKNAEGRYLAVNDAYRRALGLQQVEIVGRMTQEILPHEIADRFLREDAEVMQMRVPLEREEKSLTTDDTMQWFEVWRCAVLENDGSVLGTVGVARNVNARKQLEAQLRLLNRELEFRVSERTREALDLYNNAPCGYHSLDPGGLVLAMNETELSWLGYSRAEVVGKMRYPELLSPDEAAAFPGLFFGFTQTGDSTMARWHMRRKDGTLFPVLVSVRAIRDEAGRFLRTQAMVVDFSERERAETELRLAKEQAEAANRSKTIFLGNVSHELRTPLNSVLGFAQLLLRESSLTGSQREFVGAIYRNGEHLVEIIGEIIEMARLESGRAVLKCVEFDGHSLLEQIGETFRERCEFKQLQMSIKPSADLIRHLQGDLTKIRQIFFNLVGNAVKFTSRGDVFVRLSSSLEQDGRIRLDGEVEDTGPGMSSDELIHLFEPFYQAESGRASGGTGLGLSITRQLLRMMDGEISVSSEPGRGTCCRFYVYVSPGNAEKEVGTTVSNQASAPKTWNQELVLVADDEPDNRVLLKCTLEPLGLQVEFASDGAEAVHRYIARRHRFVLIDLQMPVMDGFDAIRHIRLHSSTSECRMIALTAGAIDLSRPRAIAAGADACVAKPVQIEMLLTLMHSLDCRQSREVSTDSVDVDRDSTAAEATAMFNGPLALLSAMASAALDADYPRLLELCDEVEKADPAAARRIRQMVSDFDYDAIFALCDRTKLINKTSQRPDRSNAS